MPEDRPTCSECGRPLGYMMQVNHKAPGLMALLRGEGGEWARLGLTIAVCLLVVLILTGLEVILQHH